MGQRIGRGTIVDLLALTLGNERAQTSWSDAVRGLGLPEGESYTSDQAFAVLAALSSAPSTTGVAARLAALKLKSGSGEKKRVQPPWEHTDAALPRAPRRGSSSEAPPPATPSVDILSFLAPSLGEEKANEVLAEYAGHLNVSPSALTRDDALRILDAMSRAAGLLGVVARFAKARYLLRGPAG